MFDGKLFGEEIAAMMREHVAREIEKATAPLLARLNALEARPEPEDHFAKVAPLLKSATDATAEIVARLDALEARPLPEKGDPGEPGKDGVDGKDGVPGRDGVNGENGKDGLPGQDGKSVSLDDIMPLVEAMIEKQAKADDEAMTGLLAASGRIAAILDATA